MKILMKIVNFFIGSMILLSIVLLILNAMGIISVGFINALVPIAVIFACAPVLAPIIGLDYVLKYNRKDKE